MIPQRINTNDMIGILEGWPKGDIPLGLKCLKAEASVEEWQELMLVIQNNCYLQKKFWEAFWIFEKTREIEGMLCDVYDDLRLKFDRHPNIDFRLHFMPKEFFDEDATDI